MSKKISKDKYGFAVGLGATRSQEGFWVKLDDLIVDPKENGRYAGFTYKPPQLDGETDEEWASRWRPSNFEIADVADLLDPAEHGSLLGQGQADACKVWIDGLGLPHLHIGYRRHFALTVARDLGLTVPCPKGKEGRILVNKVVIESGEQGQLDAMAKNIAENVMRRGLSPLDLMTNLSRYTSSEAEGGFGLSRKAAAAKLGISVSNANKHLRVLGMSPALRAEWFPKLHRGAATIQAACAAMKNAGQGNVRNQTGVRKAAVQLAFKHAAQRPAPKLDLNDAEAELLVACLFGQNDIDAVVEATGEPLMPPNVRAWYAWANANKADVAAPAPTTPKKKAPPKQTPKGSTP